jgi:hypothetical protein
MTIFKFFVLLTSNILIGLTIRRQEKSAIAKMRVEQESDARHKYRNTNIILLSSVTMYLITQLPSLVMNCLMIAADSYQTLTLKSSVRAFANPFISMALLSNYSFNFFLYCTVSERFRVQFLRILSSRRGSASSTSNTSNADCKQTRLSLSFLAI